MHALRNSLMKFVILIAVLSSVRVWSQTAARTELKTQNSRVPHPEESKIDWNAPLPSASELKKRVLANLKRSEAEQERYVCKTVDESVETDKNGNLKKRRVEGRDMFFVNGQEIDELTSKNGKPLNADQQKKEEKRVKKKIEKDSDMKYVAKKDADNEKQLDMLLHMLRYTNGHRVDRDGRSTLSYDLSGDPSVHPKSVEETFLHDMMGTIEVDEKTGELVDLNARLDHDVKIGGGLVANLHKGFWIHVRQQRYPDGVWLPELLEGNGDARAALFFHPYFRFSDTMNGCALTSVTTSQGASSIAK
jgi:hypothetical protein